MIRRCSVKSALKTHDCTSSLQRVAKLYNDLESRLYNFDETQGNSEDMKIFLAEENQRIEGELLEMNNFEVKMASSIMSKKLFLSDIRASTLLAKNIKRLDLLPSYDHFDSSVADYFGRFNLQNSIEVMSEKPALGKGKGKGGAKGGKGGKAGGKSEAGKGGAGKAGGKGGAGKGGAGKGGAGKGGGNKKPAGGKKTKGGKKGAKKG